MPIAHSLLGGYDMPTYNLYVGNLRRGLIEPQQLWHNTLSLPPSICSWFTYKITTLRPMVTQLMFSRISIVDTV